MRKRMMEKLRKISTMYYLRQIVACLLVYCMLLAVPMQVALAEVVMTSNPAGAITVSPLVGGTQGMTATNGAIGYFSDFDIASGNSVNCVQTTNLSNALFKVFGNGTEILGSFTANGNIYLIDPAGIIFGQNSQINVNKLVASGLYMEDQDFLDFTNGVITKMKFQGGPGGVGSGAEVTNEGTINATDSAYLVGTQVLNTGTITSPIVVLAAGEKVYLNHSGSNVFIEMASDLETPVPADNTVDNSGTINATGQVLLAAGDIFSTAITGVDSLAAVANRNVELGGDFEAGEITLTADADGVDGGRVYAGGTSGTSGSLTSTTGDIEISASDDTKIQLGVDIDAAEDLLLNNNTTVQPGKTLKAGQDVILTDSKTMLGYGDLTVEGDRDIILGGDVLAYGTLTLKADADTVDHEPGAETGGIMWAKSTLGTMFGNFNIDIYGNAILLDNHVTAAQDLILNNDTIVKDTGYPGITLKAANNVDSKADLIAKGNLTIEATGGEIIAKRIDMDSVGSTLTLKQNNKLDLEENIEEWDGRIKTHLVATSTADSITSIAASKWLDITATADENITLSDESGEITTLQLTATNGDVKITANDGKLYAEGPISAGRDVKLTATDEGSDAIFLHENVDAGRDIWLNNNTYAYGPISLTAGQDMRLGYNENLDKYDAKTLTAEESLTIEADRHITLGGDVTVIGSLPETLTIKADADTVDEEPEAVPGGDVWAMGKLTTIDGENNDILVYGDNIRVDGMVSSADDIVMKAADDLTLASNVEAGGNIDLYSSDDTTYLGGSLVKASGDLTLHNNTVLNGTGLNANQSIRAENGSLYANGSVHKTSTGNLEMFGGYNDDYYWSVDTKEVRVEDGELDIAGNAYVNLDGDIYSSGRMELTSNADGDGSFGYMQHVSGTIKSVSDDVDMDAVNDNIDLFGGNPTEYVTAGGDILLRSNTNIVGDRKLHADDDVVLAAGSKILTGGNLTIEAGDDIILGVDDVANHETTPAVGTSGLVRAYGDLLLDAGGDVYAHGQLDVPSNKSGDIDIYSRDGTTYLWDDVTAQGGGDVILHNNTVVKASYKTLMSNYDDVVLAGGMTLSSDYDLTIKAGDDIILGSNDADYHWVDPFDGTAGNVSANGDLTLMAPLGSVYAHGTLTTDPGSGGTINIYSSDATTYLWDNVTSDVDVILNNDTEVKAAGKKLDAGRDVILSNGKTLDSDYDLTIEADRDITLGGPVNANDSFEAYAGLDTGLLGGDILAKDNIEAASIVLSASNGEGYSYSHVDVAADKTLTSTTGDITVEAHHDVSLGGAVNSAGNLKILADQHNNYEDGGVPVTHTLGGDVDADDILTAAADIKISGNNIDLDEDVVAGGSIELTSGTSHDFTELWWGWDTPYGEMYAGSDLLAGTDVTINGNITLDEGDWVFDDVLGAWLWDGDQFITALSGTITATGGVWKYTPGKLTMYGGSPDLAVDLQNPGSLLDEDSAVATAGNLYIRGNGDIQIAGDVTALGGHYWWNYGEYPDIPQGDVVFPADVGGVSIISENGKIYTEDGLDNDTLNVAIEGYSSQADDMGVELPLNPDRKAAIVIISKDDLKLGTDSELIAEGMYYTTSEEFDLTDIDNWDAFDIYIASLEAKYGSSAIEELEQNFEEYLGYDTDEIEDFAVLKGLLEGYLDSIGGLTLYADDRAAVGLLATDGTSIGGVLRDEGEPIDIAIYLASTEGDVDFSGSASITSYEPVRNHAIGNNNEGPYIPEFEPEGTMVIDAYDTVTLGDFGETPVVLTIPQDFLDSYSFYTLEAFLEYEQVSSIEELLAQSPYDNVQDFLWFKYEYYMETEEPQGRFIDVDRLEVVSRITEWLFQAVGRLPFVYDPAAIAAFEDFIGGDYILRGAGLDNPLITDERAWVLEDPTPPAPLYEEAGQAAERLTIGVQGCPVLVAAASAELGIPSDTIQVSLANSFALNTNIQPCESCARLLNAADILSDEGGSGMAALNQVFNELAPANVAFTPEVAASIVTAFAGRVGDGTQYATAIDYIDAFVRYIAVLDAEMGSPVGDGDSIAFVMEKYGSGITENENSNIAAFIATRLESGETFGE
jgi:filamentous hemagglutinin family protein